MVGMKRGLSRLVHSRALRLAGTAVGVFLLVRSVNIGAAAQTLAHADFRLGLLGVALTAVGVISTVTGWSILIRGTGAHVAWHRLASWYLQGVFAGHVAPTGAAGDAVRAVGVTRAIGSGRGLASLAASRMSGAIGMALFGFIGAVVLMQDFGLAVVIGAALYLAAMLLSWVIAFRLHGPIGRMRDRSSRLARRAGEMLHPFTESFQAFRERPGALVKAVILGIGGWAVNMLALQVFAASVGVHQPPMVFAVTIPISLIATWVPVAINGIGLREGVLIGLLAHLGENAAHAGALALLIDVQLVPFALMGAALFVLARRRAARLEPVPVPALTA